MKGARRKSEQGLKLAGLNYIANLASEARELPGAASLLEQALSLCGSGHRRERAYTLLHLARVRALMGAKDAAAELFSSALVEFRGIGDFHGSTYANLHLAILGLDSGSLPAARELLGAAMADASLPELALPREIAQRLMDKPAPAKAKPAGGGRS